MPINQCANVTLADARTIYERSQTLDSERKSLAAKIADLDAQLGRP